MTVRQQTEQMEHEFLAPGASFADGSRGRFRPEEECSIRTCYQRDRDRVLHCNSFRRLKDKTQVFLAPVGDHYRTRLTHTLEVSQISRTIARALRLNEDLTEAIALAHDLGHAPFGHTGEAVLNDLAPHGLHPNNPTGRVLQILENTGKGLNLTWEVRNGAVCHSSASPLPATLEGCVVRISDKIAYLNHDIEDACRAGVLREEEVPYDVRYVLGRDKAQRITALVRSVIAESSAEGPGEIKMSPEVRDAFIRLREFMFAEVYRNPQVKEQEEKAQNLVKQLYQYYYVHIDALPGQYREAAANEGKARAVCDYLSGMSDRFARASYERLFLPKSWDIP